MERSASRQRAKRRREGGGVADPFNAGEQDSEANPGSEQIEQAEQRHECNERRATINGNVEFSLLLRAVPFNARRSCALALQAKLCEREERVSEELKRKRTRYSRTMRQANPRQVIK